MRALERRKGWKSWKNSSFWRLSDNFRGASYRINPRCPVTPGVRRIWVSDPYKPILEARPRKPQAPHLAEGTKIAPRRKYPSLGGGGTHPKTEPPQKSRKGRGPPARPASVDPRTAPAGRGPCRNAGRATRKRARTPRQPAGTAEPGDDPRLHREARRHRLPQRRRRRRRG